MLKEKEFLNEEKDCAKLLGITLKEYQKYKKEVKVTNRNTKSKCEKYDNSILKSLGLTTKDLKTRRIGLLL